MFYSTKDECWDLRHMCRRPELECLHTEADTIMFYIYSQLRVSGVTDTVILDAEDTDVVALSAKVAHEMEGDLGLSLSLSFTSPFVGSLFKACALPC